MEKVVLRIGYGIAYDLVLESVRRSVTVPVFFIFSSIHGLGVPSLHPANYESSNHFELVWTGLNQLFLGFGISKLSQISIPDIWQYVSIHINLHIVTYVFSKPNDYEIEKAYHLELPNTLVCSKISRWKIVLK